MILDTEQQDRLRIRHFGTDRCGQRMPLALGVPLWNAGRQMKEPYGGDACHRCDGSECQPAGADWRSPPIKQLLTDASEPKGRAGKCR